MHTSHSLSTRVSAFAGHRLVAVGPLRSVALSARQALDAEPNATILIFDDVEQRQVEIDLRGTMADLVQRLAATPDSAARSFRGNFGRGRDRRVAARARGRATVIKASIPGTRHVP